MASLTGLSSIPKGLKKAKFEFEWGLRVIHTDGLYRLIMPYATLETRNTKKDQYVACRTLCISRSDLAPKYFTIVACTELIPADVMPEPTHNEIEYILETQEYTPGNLEIIWNTLNELNIS